MINRLFSLPSFATVLRLSQRAEDAPVPKMREM